MFTLSAHALDGSRLFDDWQEGAALWQQVGSRHPGLVGLVLLPSQLHLVHPLPDTAGLEQAMRSYAQWRNARRGERGPVWLPHLPPKRLSSSPWLALRDLHLLPCRAGLVRCPLAWPLSTHRECLGLVAPAVRKPVPDPVALHEWTSSDPSCRADGTALPRPGPVPPRVSLDLLLAAVSEYLRRPLPLLYRRGPARTLAIAAARSLTTWPAADIADRLGVHPSTVCRTRPAGSVAATAIACMVIDPRFAGLGREDPRLARPPAWSQAS